MKKSVYLERYSRGDFERHCVLLVGNGVYGSLREAKKSEGKWLENVLRNYRKKKPLFYVFGIKFSGELIGNIVAENIDYENMNLQVGFWIGKDYRNRGFATSALKMFIKFLRKNFKPKRIQASHYSGNKSSEKVLKNCGFVYEGTERNVSKRGNKFFDELVYSIVR